MVNIENIYVTMSTIAIVSEHVPAPISIDAKELEPILKRPVTIGQSPAGLVVSSQRDQLEVIAGGNKLNVRDLSGKTVFSESKIPPVLDFFIRKTGFKVSTYGINFIIAVPCKEPAQWIRDNVFAPDISGKIGKTVVGGAALLNIAFGNKVWNIKLEPGEGQAISVDFNASETTQQLPDQAMLRTELQEQFHELQELLTKWGL